MKGYNEWFYTKYKYNGINAIEYLGINKGFYI
jgi:hypothetical protein